MTRFFIASETAPNGWETLADVSINDNFFIHQVSEDLTHAYALSRRGRDKSALVRVSLPDMSETILAEDPQGDIFLTQNINRFDDQIDGVILTTGTHGFIPLTPYGEKFARLLGSLGERLRIDGFNATPDGKVVSLSYEPEGLPWKYAIFDMENEKVIPLGDHPLRDHIDTLSKPEFVTFKARDGLMLNGILTRAKGVHSAGPAVIYIHGGPAMFSRWGYGQYTQFLVNRGYTVFDLNYRGSTGYGKAFQQSGFREYGRKMQDDIWDARDWLVGQGIADPDSIAVTGASYGGYASAMAMTRDPEFFAAGIVEFPMLDVEYQSRFPPLFWGLGLETWYRYFGDPSKEGIRDEMKKNSPQTQIGNLTGPLLVIAGREDRVVGYAQTKRFVMDAEAANKNVEFVVFNKAGHGLTRWQDKITHARRLEDFLAKHLGGRSGNWDWIELAAQYFD